MEVECIEGYTLVGSNTLTCGKGFDYTARKLPECVPIAGCEVPVIGSDMNLTSTCFVHCATASCNRDRLMTTANYLGKP